MLCLINPCRLRNKLNSIQEASGGKRISVNDLVIKVLYLKLSTFILLLI